MYTSIYLQDIETHKGSQESSTTNPYFLFGYEPHTQLGSLSLNDQWNGGTSTNQRSSLPRYDPESQPETTTFQPVNRLRHRFGRTTQPNVRQPSYVSEIRRCDRRNTRVTRSISIVYNLRPSTIDRFSKTYEPTNHRRYHVSESSCN